MANQTLPNLPPSLERFTHWMTRRDGRLALGLFTLALALATIWLVAGAPLDLPASPSGIQSLACAGTAQEAAGIIAAWASAEPHSLVPLAILLLGLDFFFLLAYFPLVALGCFLLAGRIRAGINRADAGWTEEPAPRTSLSQRETRLAGVVFWLGLVGGISQLPAALFDLVENTTLLAQLFWSADSQLAWLAFWSARGKIVLGGLGIIALAAAAVFLIPSTQRRFPLLQYLWFCRFPIVLGLALIVLGPVAVLVLPLILRNIFDLEGTGFGVAAFQLLVASWTIQLTLRNILLYGDRRFDVREPALAASDWVHRHATVLLIWLNLPLLVTVLIVSAEGVAPVLPIGIGIALGLVFMSICRLVQVQFGDPGRDPKEALQPAGLETLSAALERVGPAPSEARGESWLRRLEIWVARLLKSYLPGYFSPDDRILPGHLQALLFLSLTGVVYLLMYWPLRPGEWGWGLRLPSLAYLLGLFVFGAWILPGAAFFLDRFRVPTLLSLVLIVLVSIYGADHYYEVIPGSGSAPPTPQEAFDRAEEASPAQARPAVVVAASGGGIMASLWTARVLTQLQEDGPLGQDFARSLRLLSSASGGSVGVMAYLDAYLRRGEPPWGESDRIVESAGASSLDALGWGFVYLDIWRGFFPGLFASGLLDRDRDRSWALEQVWRQRLTAPNTRLSGWLEGVNGGTLPPAVLNATVVENGRQYLFTPLGVPPEWQAESFHADHPGEDIDIATAARLSSTFPWITPIARPSHRSVGPEPGADPHPDAKHQTWHLADGGYYDNFGVVTVINWLQTMASERLEKLREKGVILVLINAFGRGEQQRRAPMSALCCPQPEPERGWIYATVGPLLMLETIRTSTQLRRNNLELDLMMQQLEESQIPVRRFSFELRIDAPLSWKLTDEEKSRILEAWNLQHNRDQLLRLQQCFHGIAGCE